MTASTVMHWEVIASVLLVVAGLRALGPDSPIKDSPIKDSLIKQPQPLSLREALKTIGLIATSISTVAAFLKSSQLGSALVEYQRDCAALEAALKAAIETHQAAVQALAELALR